jgi:hypothetical protein
MPVITRIHFDGQPDRFSRMLALFRGVPIHQPWWRRVWRFWR